MLRHLLSFNILTVELVDFLQYLYSPIELCANMSVVGVANKNDGGYLIEMDLVRQNYLMSQAFQNLHSIVFKVFRNYGNSKSILLSMTRCGYSTNAVVLFALSSVYGNTSNYSLYSFDFDCITS